MTASRDVALGSGAEFDLIRAMRERWGALAVGVGDDAAVIRPARGEQLVVSVDAAAEGVSFRREWLSSREIGYRAVTAALSDLAAMAAAPMGVLVAIAVASDAHEELMELADGIADAVRAARSVIVGGNLTRAERLSLTTTVLGSAFVPVTRSGARPGDLLYVTGRLGGPAAALRSFEAGKDPSPEVRARFATPVARLAEARWLAARGVTAAIDLSDGLVGDAGHLAAASDVALEIQMERVPVFPGASMEDALGGGEEFELLLAARSPLPDQEFSERFAVPITPIGRIVEGSRDVRVMRDGKRVATPKGYDHFSR